MTDAVNAIKTTILGNTTQVFSERAVLHLRHDADILALQNDLMAELATWPRGREGAGAERIETAVQQWTAGLIIDEISYLRRDNPDFVLGSDTAPRRWFGHTFPGNGKAGDNPDAIYRSTVIDGRGRYEVTGRVDPERPSAQLLFSMFAGTLTHPVEVKQEPGAAPNPDAGLFKNLGNLTDQNLKIEADGSFRILLGGEPDGGNHLPTEPVPCSFGCRQILLDWTTPPLQLAIRRLDQAETSGEVDMQEVKRSVMNDLAKSVKFWAGYPDVWLGGVKTNGVVPPAPREGGWGFIGGVNFQLQVGEAAVVTVHPGAAAYMGFQLTDPWMMAPDHGRYQTCLNRTQSVADADGRYTYVVSPVDPGVANWIDSCGMQEGMGLMRWQGFPSATDGSGLFHSYRIMSLTDVDALSGVARITPEQRAHQISNRRQSFFSRFSAT